MGEKKTAQKDEAVDVLAAEHYRYVEYEWWPLGNDLGIKKHIDANLAFRNMLTANA